MDYITFKVTIPQGNVQCVVIKRERFNALSREQYGAGNFSPAQNGNSWQGYVGIDDATGEKFPVNMALGSRVGRDNQVTFDCPTLELQIPGEGAYPRWIGFDSNDHFMSCGEAVERTMRLAVDLLTRNDHDYM